ncbi:MAG: single-stranded DNA-binding protein [Thermodesulfobacteriaceae bacterium]|nr:single-stranded DNA-binding protein [Thermodesulfobacteriaceae bacterium]MCX8041023.1 single-stranded DNA-binding protein [Thermodesulfobacteriaceae bacterium]MDW8135262.1 single-stranded DNA-binding protein [Thermodesulfobacterium sp.]
MSVNKVLLLGRLGADPEIRYTLDGKPVAVFRIATNEVIIKDGEKEVLTEWHRIVAFGRLAEICGEYLNKGTRIYVEGKLRTRKFEDKQGNIKYVTEIVAQNLQILDNKKSFPSENTSLKEDFSPSQLAEEPPFDEEDLPF